MGESASMLNAAWQGFLGEIDCWRDAGRQIDFWWRDDDASRPDPALTRLITLAETMVVPLALAVIPAQAQGTAFVRRLQLISLLQHGVDHRNRAGVGEKKTEFTAAEPVSHALARLRAGRAQLESLPGIRVLPVLVPPWNRISAPQLVPQLPAAGYCGLSTFGPRRHPFAAPGVAQVNTHVDIIDWRGTRGFAGEEVVLAQATQHLVARRKGSADAAEPTGWLTHHAVHDAAAWAFMERLLERTAAVPGVSWRSAAQLFEPGAA